MCGELGRGRGVELAVKLGLDEEDLVAFGRGIHRASLRAACASIWRARHSRDMTVPIGVRVISAISL